MNRAAVAVTLMISISVSGSAFGASKRRVPDLDFQSIEDYFDRNSGGAISASTQLGPRALALRFTYDSRRRPFRIRTRTPMEVELNQGLFWFDASKFTSARHRADFLSAKRNYYAELDFDEKYQHHVQRYYHLEGWDQLFHPPVKKLGAPLESYWSAMSPYDPAHDPALDAHPYFDPAFQERIDARSNTELTSGNTVELFANGESYRPKIELVENAREHVYVSIMFLACDESSDRLADALIKKAREGIDVRLVTERVYRESLGRNCVRRLINGGVKVAVSSTSVQSATFTSAMHQKIWIRDGEEAIIGGENILDYESEGTGFNYMNRDADARFKGPVVTDLEEQFLLKWRKHAAYSAAETTRESTDERLIAVRNLKARERAEGKRGQAHYGRWLSDRDQRMNGLCRAASQDVHASGQPIGPIIEEHLRAARSRVVLTTPDLIFNPYDPENADKQDTHINRIMRLLYERKEANDPKVTVLTNGEGGGAGEISIYFQHRYMEHQQEGHGVFGRITRQLRDYTARRAASSNRAHSWRLQGNPNVDVWHYFQYMHAKLYHFDRIASVVGSWNLDHNSGDLNHEVAVVCMDDSLRKRIEHDLVRDLVNSVPVVSKNHK